MAEPLSDTSTRSELLVCLEQMRPRLVQRLKASRIPPADSEDLLQETFLALLQLRHHGHSVKSMEGWLFGVLRIKIRSFWRDRGRERDFHASIALQPERHEPPPHERVQTVYDSQKLIAAMPLRDLQLIWLHYALEIDPEEAAWHLNCRPESVRKLSRRALQRIRRSLVRQKASKT